MWVYILLLFVVFFILIFSIVYLVKLTHRFLKNHIKNKTLSWILSFVPILLFVPGLFIDMVNAIVVDIHLIIIISLTKLIFFIVKKITKKEVNEYLVLGIGIVLTALLMTHAYYLAHHVVETDYTIYTKKNIGLDNFRIIQVSDSHLGTTMNGKEFSKYMEDINKLNPDIVVITGDFVDDDSSYEDMVDVCTGLGKLKTKYGVYFIYGNHDKGYYNNRKYNDEDIRKELIKNNVKILDDKSLELTDNIVLVGRKDKEDRNRDSAINLTKGIDKSKYIIILNHQPNDYKNEVNNADLVLSGHTHGGQIFPLGQFGILLGSNDKIYGMEKRKNTTFIVNSGISDWAIKFKTGTIAEYAVIDIKESKESGETVEKEAKVTIDNKDYVIDLDNNETTKKFLDLLPQEFNMTELNGNEKYIYLDKKLPTNASNPKKINAGDVMLYGDNCLVIFYKSFETSYSYTRIGHINNLPDLGDGNINVKIVKK